MNIAVQVGRQNGKLVLVGMLTGQEIIAALKDESLAVNPSAQRSLARGARRSTTKELLDDELVHKTPRMKEFVGFLHRLMDLADKGQKDQGFFGAIQLIIPKSFTGARFQRVDLAGGKQGEMMVLKNAMTERRLLGTLVATPKIGESMLHVADGQGRCVGFHSLEKVATDWLSVQRKKIKKLEATQEDTAEAHAELQKLEDLRNRARKYLSDTDVPFVIYVDTIKDDGSVIGLDDNSEKRLYIEGNALNTMAGKEEIIKFETFSPVVLALQSDREDAENYWMTDDYIESDSKSISSKNVKVFTLSTLVQAYAWSMIGDSDAITVNQEMFEAVLERHEFVQAYWKKIGSIFAPTWAPEFATPTERLNYMQQKRDEQNVTFSAIFLQALGQLGFELNERCKSDPKCSLLDNLDILKTLNYDARGAEDDGSVSANEWTNAMMKPKLDDDQEITGYVFNNTRDTVAATANLLLGKLNLPEGE